MLACRPYPLIFLCFEKYRYLTPSFDRPSFRQMEQMIEAGEVGTVIVKDDCVITSEKQSRKKMQKVVK